MVNTEHMTAEQVRLERAAARAINISMAVNVVLFVGKIAAAVYSHSLSVIASALDSALDLLSQGVIWYGHRQSKSQNEAFPVGRARLSPVGILVCSVLMFAGAIEVIRQSATTIAEGIYGTKPDVDFGPIIVAALLGVTGLKLMLFLYCRLGKGLKKSPDVQALGSDHRNDVLTNSIAVVFGAIGYFWRPGWFMDATGAMLLSCYIAWSWFNTGKENMNKIVGAEASPEQIAEISDIIDSAEDLELDWLRAYHLGHNIIVEVEVVMDPNLPLRSTHDSAMRLQQRIEQLEFVERAYVHVDYEHRHYDEHKQHSFPYANPQSHIHDSPSQETAAERNSLLQGSNLLAIAPPEPSNV